MSEILGLYAGTLQALEPEGQPTGIFKQAIESAGLTELGLVGDQQADRRVHGGPEKALHQFARASYDVVSRQFPGLAGVAVPGTFGENVSSDDLDDRSVCIGDTYRIGTALVQVSQPRRPCWKINHRFDCRDLSKLIDRRQLTGWYYRVLKAGTISVGDSIELLERVNEELTIALFTQTITRHRPDPAALDRLISARHLNPDWCQRLQQRRDYLAARASAA